MPDLMNPQDLARFMECLRHGEPNPDLISLRKWMGLSPKASDSIVWSLACVKLRHAGFSDEEIRSGWLTIVQNGALK